MASTKSSYIQQTLGELPAVFDSVTETYEHVKALDLVSSNAKRRILIVLDHVPTEDLANGRLCYGPTGELLMNMFDYLQHTFPVKYELSDLDVRIINYNLFRTYGKTEAFVAEANEFFNKKLRRKIADYKPDMVLTFGPNPFRALNAQKITFAKDNYQNWYGVTIPSELKYGPKGAKTHKYIHEPNISLNSV